VKKNSEKASPEDAGSVRSSSRISQKQYRVITKREDQSEAVSRHYEKGQKSNEEEENDIDSVKQEPRKSERKKEIDVRKPRKSKKRPKIKKIKRKARVE